MRFPLARRTAVTLLTTGFALALVATAAPAQAAPPPPPNGNVQPQIIGGTDVPNDAYPFMAALLDKGPGSPLERAVCGGSLIGAATVMTAAHCVGGDPATLEVVVGRTVLSNSQQGEVRNVTEISSHPLYGKQPGYDIALLRLDKPVDGITPIQLPTRGTDGLIRPGTKAKVIGWGNTDTAQPHFPDRLRQVDVPFLSHNECEIAYPKEIGLDAYNRATEVCAGVEGKDSCQGDSGGPLFRTVPGTQTYIQIGIVSRGEGCAAQGGPGVYTYIGSKVLWDTMSEAKAAQR
ncbi:secreted trypsin-like serine protease [Kibdelosporangium banguiense]|uniref:Secreted trypsin-like serine protease n=1 Tax=Kibdelosporangium banguiense TaxID=1365924 RepID=A0ABS4TYH8_9PSEU|nr:serine protease [Kibdelosporangium banguiense]MBP2329437.1 secreted trypsin-like serine protease [Kibdelosporangium banguiense]